MISKKLNKIINPNDYSNSFLDNNKLSKTAYLSKNNSGKNSLDKKNVKNNYNIYCFNSKLIQRNDDKNINSINNINSNNNESSRGLYDSMNKKIKTNNNNGINFSNDKNSTKPGHNYSQIYIIDSNNKNNNIIINEENTANKNKNIEIKKLQEKKDSLYNYLNSTKKYKHIYHIKSTSDIYSKNISSNNPIISAKFSSLSNNNKINNLQNLNLNSISNNNANMIDNNPNTNRTNDNKNIHFRSNSNLYANNSREGQDIIYKKKISIKQKEKHKSSSINSNKDRSKSNSQFDNEESSGIKIKSARGIMPKQETIKAKLIKNLLPLSNYQSPLENNNKKIMNNYWIK